MLSQDSNFHLFAQSFGHSSDVRDVVSLSEGRYASCSRDGTIKLWERVENGYETKKTLTGHQKSTLGISALLYIKPGLHPIFKDGALVSASYDKTILIWDNEVLTGQSSDPIMQLSGHFETPTCLSLSTDGKILSGGSDNYARVWVGNKNVQELKGHSFPIWGIISLSNGDIVTCSGDKTIKIWRNGQVVKSLPPSSESVRGLCDIPGVGFLSCGNDMSIKLWSYDGHLLRELFGHSNIVYKVIILPTGEFASASEDATVKIWKDYDCVQTISHPAGVWSVASLENGDIVTACQDGVSRVYSRDPSRIADENTLKAFNHDILMRQKSAEVGDLSLDQIPGEEALNRQGQANGDTQLIKKDGKAWLYSWSTETNSWNNEGEITDAIDKAPKKELLDGVEYDFIFSAELGDGGPMKKIGYNEGENPYLVAQEFILQNDLSQNFLEQIARFVIQQVPSAQTARGPLRSRKPKEQTQQAQPRIAPSKSIYFPERSPLKFQNATFDQILAKIKEFNNAFASNPDTAKLALDNTELSNVELVVGKLSQTSRYHVTNFSKKEFETLYKLLQWPSGNVFPVLDLIRLTVLHPEAIKQFHNDNLIEKVLGVKKEGAHAANTSLILKALSNCFVIDSERSKMIKYDIQVLDYLADLLDTLDLVNKATRLAMATLILNLTVLYLTNQSNEGAPRCLSLITEILSQEKEDPEIVLRLLVSLGNLIYNDTKLKQLAKEYDVNETLEQILRSPLSPDKSKVANCIKDIQALFK